ncbi:MAG: urease accessory protein UreJ [Alkalinema sp. CACIAM 70d]|nr:MAG: urease accessory protein UreJ [Alkalinema sp. CACIAM 70d]
MNQFQRFNHRLRLPFLSTCIVLPLLTSALLLKATPALAHHAMGGGMPSNLFEGFMSGLAHPVIGIDHLAFIVAIGLLAAIKRHGIWIPIAFVLAAMLGTGAHLAKFSFPGVELFVSGSIVLVGALLVMKNSPKTGIVTILAAIAGLFHGYAYGESIFGAETTPLVAYLAGFTVIQLVISITTFWIGHKATLTRKSEVATAPFRSAGLVVLGMGVAFFASQLINVLLPISAA